MEEEKRGWNRKREYVREKENGRGKGRIEEKGKRGWKRKEREDGSR
jgi:hypothetical protein